MDVCDGNETFCLNLECLANNNVILADIYNVMISPTVIHLLSPTFTQTHLTFPINWHTMWLTNIHDAIYTQYDGTPCVKQISMVQYALNMMTHHVTNKYPRCNIHSIWWHHVINKYPRCNIPPILWYTMWSKYIYNVICTQYDGRPCDQQISIMQYTPNMITEINTP